MALKQRRVVFWLCVVAAVTWYGFFQGGLAGWYDVGSKMMKSLVDKSLARGVERKAPKSPHIVFVLADDFGFNDIGYHQNKQSSANPSGKRTTNEMILTPTLDRLAAQGVRLEGYYVQPLCSPSRGSLMTGKFPSSTGFGPDVLGGPHMSAPYGVPASEEFLPQALNKYGYESHMVGKWHLGFCHKGYTPTGRGFMSHTGFFSGAESYFCPAVVRDKGMSGTDTRSGRVPLGGDVPPVYHRPQGISEEDCKSPNSTACYSTTVFASAAVDAIHNFAQSHPAGDISLFLYVAFQATHNPLTSPDIYRVPFDNNVKDWGRRLFAGMTLAMDEAVSNITQALERNGLWEDTVFIFSTDNGGEPSAIGRSNNYPLRGGKVTNWEGGVRGVGFIRGTDNRQLAPLPQNETRFQLMHISDWFPTLVTLAARLTSTESNLDLAQTGHIGSLDGVDQWGMLLKKVSAPQRSQILHNVQPNDGFLRNLPWDAIRVRDWKLHMRTTSAAKIHPPPGFTGEHGDHVPRPFNGSMFLFHIPSDPTESQNLAEAFPERLAEMIAIYKEAQKAAKPDLIKRWGGVDPSADPQFRSDKSWGPSNATDSRCAYGHEYDTV
mmetsp:Transcript_14270/g.25571  ORF Transcript_14270/g.25571 Transcript_14270/m.25571 type:complete len:604 (+) Transcript_14270:53-1864(+)